MFIKEARAGLVKNSRNESTIEVKIRTFKGTFLCSAPSGKSKGIHEVQDYNLRGMNFTLKLTNSFLRKITNKNILFKEFKDLVEIEESMKNFEEENGILGGNIFYAIEGALLKAAAAEKNIPLWKFLNGGKKQKMPQLVGNAIGGGLHTNVRHKKPDFQEFLFISNKGETISKAVSKNILAYYEAKSLVREKEKKLNIGANDENAIISSLKNEEVLEIMKRVAEKFSLDIGLDIAASGFFDEKRQFYDYQNKRFLRTKEEQVEFISILAKDFGLAYIEDPLHEEDFVSFKQLLQIVKKEKLNTLIVGDDLTTTNLSRLKRAHRAESINAIIVKPNQIGSLVEVAKVMNFCKQNKISTIFSHRSGETLDDILADYAVGFEADFIKIGILGRERLVKLARLIQIESSV